MSEQIQPAQRIDGMFETECLKLAICDLQPLHSLTNRVKRTEKYRQIVASIKTIGLVEAPVVSRLPFAPGKYLLLDGHLRVEALKDIGQAEVSCLIATDDEGFTYNRHINRLALIQEHSMILKTIELGASEQHIASALNINVASLRNKIRLLDGVCAEAKDILKDKHVASDAFWSLKKMSPCRQVEVATLMISVDKYTASYARALLAGSTKDQLARQTKTKIVKVPSDEQFAHLDRESSILEREVRLAEQDYGRDQLDLVLMNSYIAKLLRNDHVNRYLSLHHFEILAELRKIVAHEQTVSHQ